MIEIVLMYHLRYDFGSIFTRVRRGAAIQKLYKFKMFPNLGEGGGEVAKLRLPQKSKYSI